MIDGEKETEKSLDEILGSSLGEAYDAASAADDGAPPLAEGAGATADTDNRDPATGRFTARQGDAPAAGATAQIPGQGAAAPGSKPADGAAPAMAPSDVPASWSDALKPHWATLPPELKAFLQTREADFARGIEQKTQAFKPISDVIEPRREALSRAYGSVENGIKELLDLSDFAVGRPADFAKWFVHQHRLNPQELFTGAPQGASQPGAGQVSHDGGQPDAQTAAVDARIHDLESRFIQAINAPILEKAKTDLEKFEGEAATKYPHWSNPQVKNAVRAALLDADQRGDDTLTYEGAYERVIWSIPEIRQQLIEKERSAAVEARAKEAADAAKKARGVAGPQLKSVGSPSDLRGAPRSIDATMSEVYDRITGAA